MNLFLSGVFLVTLALPLSLRAAPTAAAPKVGPRIYTSLEGPINLSTLGMLLKYSTDKEPDVRVEKIRWPKNPVWYSKYIGSKLVGFPRRYYLIDLKMAKKHDVTCVLILSREQETLEFTECESPTADVRGLFESVIIPYGSVDLPSHRLNK